MRMIPNILSTMRMLCGWLVIGLLATPSATSLLLVLVVMALAEFSDLADGQIARRYDAGSDFGKIIDPLADSLYRAMVFLAFVGAGWMPVWMMAVIFSRDILVSYMRVFSQQAGITMGARASGKLKAVVQGTVQATTVILALATGLPEDSGSAGLVYGLLLIATLVTAWSAVDYARGLTRAVDLRRMVLNRA